MNLKFLSQISGMLNFRNLIIFLVWMVAIVSGCQKSPQPRAGWAIVSGRVTYAGKPLTAGYVFFFPSSAPAISCSGRLQDDGSFIFEAPIGLAKVCINTSNAKKALPDQYVEIPVKYIDPEASGLMYEVKDGEKNSDANFDLR